MAMQQIEMTGKTIDEATSKALAQLGLDRDDVSVEVLDYGKKGFLGFGAVLAKVRVSYGLEDEAAVPPPSPAPKAPEQPKIPERPKAPEQPKAPESPKVPAPAPKAERKKPERPRPERVPRPEPLEELPEVPPEDLGEPCTDEKAQKITAFLTGLLQHMDSEAQVKVYHPEEGRYKVILEGEKLGSLIGRRGETLDAIQQLTNYSVNRSGEKRVRIHVDAENYRLKREQSLQNLARKVAAKVARNRRSVTLEPMNAYERHVIHTALQDVENITTYSMGTDPNRRVIVAYAPGGRKEGRPGR